LWIAPWGLATELLVACRKQNPVMEKPRIWKSQKCDIAGEARSSPPCMFFCLSSFCLSVSVRERQRNDRVFFFFFGCGCCLFVLFAWF
jgi:hypothetical protein